MISLGLLLSWTHWNISFGKISGTVATGGKIMGKKAGVNLPHFSSGKSLAV